jgi:hypothetical protein
MVPSLYTVQGKSFKSPAFHDINQILTHPKDYLVYKFIINSQSGKYEIVYNLAFNLMVTSNKLLEMGMQDLVMCYSISVPINSA